jgi:hypothetical protein
MNPATKRKLFNFWVKVWDFILDFPFARVLFKSGLRAHQDALKQMTIILLAALAPILSSAFIDTLHLASTDPTQSFTFGLYFTQLDNSLQWGELFIYVATFCAPIFWILYKYNRIGKKFDDLFSYGLIGGVSWTAALLIFVLFRTKYISGGNLVSGIGAFLFWVVVFLAYTAMVYEARLPNNLTDSDIVETDRVNDLREKVLASRE